MLQPLTASERINRLLYLDSKTYLPGDILAKVDRMSMAHSLEAREPLLDHKLIEFVATLPGRLKLGSSGGKHLLKTALRGIVPDSVIDRPKHGFSVPIRKWLNVELREMLFDILTDTQTRQRGYFNQRAVEAILSEHARGRRDNSHHLWGLLSLELWHRTFIDRLPALNFTGAKRVKMARLAAPALPQLEIN
jgi:asparagine synthase (glutamine-hydrolysing)